MLLPVTGTDSQWYKNIKRDPQVTVSAGDQTLNGRLRIIAQKPEVNDVIALFIEKYGSSDIRKYYPKPNVAASLSLD